jgi:hypothetical protein
MVRKILSASVATALLVGSVTPAFAQPYAFAPEQAPAGLTATVNLKVPLGVAPAKQRKATYGFTTSFGQRLDSLTADGRIATRSAKLADIRFTDSLRLKKAEVVTFDLANLDKDKRLNLGPDGGKGTTTWIVVGLVAAGVAICLAADCFDGNDDDEDDDDTL